jgi:undecaprenyl-diphosphatase
MLTEITLALIQATTEFLPISSSGHLALFSNLISKPDLFFFTVLHLASLIAVIIFTREEIASLFKFDKQAKQNWVYLIIATIPAGLVGLFFNSTIEQTFSSYVFLASAFLFTAIILFLTKFTTSTKNITLTSALIIGALQILALFPGVSRSGITISTAMFLGIKRPTAAKFSFLLFIPLSIGAFILELSKLDHIPSTISYLLPFVVCLIASLFFLNILMKIINKNNFWLFSFYCLALAIIIFLTKIMM